MIAIRDKQIKAGWIRIGEYGDSAVSSEYRNQHFWSIEMSDGYLTMRMVA